VYFNISESDLDEILEHTPGVWAALKAERIFITGGTGFFGRWVLASILHANKRLGTGIQVVVMSRNPAGFLSCFPEAGDPMITLHQGDLRYSEFPAGPFSRIIHLATDSKFSDENEHLQIMDGIISGTRRLLDFSVGPAQAKGFLYASSGALYGALNKGQTQYAEDCDAAPLPDNPRALIGNAKRMAEQMCTLYHARYGLQTKVARCFAFVGPHLPMNSYFAMGNFIRDAVEKDKITIAGDGSPVRSYLYAADLTAWLWQILVQGQSNRAYNVGSDQSLDMKNLGHLVKDAVAPEKSVEVLGDTGKKPDLSIYVPSIERANKELGLKVWTPLEEAVRRTAKWYAEYGEADISAGSGLAEAAVTDCRVCGGELLANPLLQFENMPGAAQYMPDKDGLAADVGENLTVCQCPDCGLVQLNSAPVSYYREVVRAAGFSDEMKAFRRGQFEEFSKEFDLAGRKVLEVGCGKGEYLHLLNDQGMKAEGLEYAQASVDECLASGMVAHQGYLDDDMPALSGGPYDAFVMLNFLEHMPDPRTVLKNLSANLTDGGIGLIEVPNFDMIIKEGLFSEFISDHLFYFTRDTLLNLLNISGFEVLDCQTVWHDYSLSATVRKRPLTDLSGFLDDQKKVCAEINRFIDNQAAGQVAIWGAGHQALAVISLAKLAGRVKYVVDSADFKQGKFTPATHLPIVSPATLVSDPVNAVIVMAASYSDEVTRIIRRDYDASIDVAVLRPFGLERV
jgi:nucleoside-diphosphate-sugar epimerase/2-polyprenyl-3-methyl-5-hydroxy-6-metoxy-1,4-benzoquinol methylase